VGGQRGRGRLGAHPAGRCWAIASSLRVAATGECCIVYVLWAVLELMVSGGSVRSGGPGRCGASTLALSQLIDLNILEFHTPF